MAFLTLKQATQALPGSTTVKGSLLSAIEVDSNLLSLNADIQTRVLKTGDTLTGALNWSAIQTIASAATTNIAVATSNVVTVSGTTTITALGTIAAGAERTVFFSGSLTLTHNATSLILPYAANITTAAKDVAKFVSLGAGNWQCVSYSRDITIAGTTDQYLRGDKTWTDFFTSVRAATLTGLSLVASTAVTAADTVLVAIGKLQAQVSTKQATLVSNSNIKTVNNTTLLGPGNIQVGKLAEATPINGTRLAVNTQYHINGSVVSGFIYYLPSGTIGQEIEFVDMYGNWNTGAWYVGYDATGGKVMGLTENMLVNRANYNFTLVWTDATGGWRIK